jgi:hypothetical protein
MTNEELVEEMLIKAYYKGFLDNVLNEAQILIDKGVDRYDSFYKAYINNNEIYRRRYKR